MNNIKSKAVSNVFSGNPLKVGDIIEFHRAEYEKGNIFKDEMIKKKFNEFISVLGEYAKFNLSQPFSTDSWGTLITIDKIIKPGVVVRPEKSIAK